MNLATILPVVATAAGAVAMVAVYWWSKPHKEHVEDQEQEAAHVTAISSASETLAGAVNVLIDPMNQAIVRLQDQERSLAIEVAKLKMELSVVRADRERDVGALVRYVQTLLGQMDEAGVVPAAVPDELRHVDLGGEGPGGHTGM